MSIHAGQQMLDHFVAIDLIAGDHLSIVLTIIDIT